MEIMSIETSDRCAKACSFCYSASVPSGQKSWDADELVSFVLDCAAGGVKAFSFGGGEPLQYPPIFYVLEKLKGRAFRSLTTNGLLLDENLDALVAAAPDKVHVSIHFPDDLQEVQRVICNVKALESSGIKSGVNFLVARSQLHSALTSAALVRAAGILNDRIVYLPMRGRDTPTPEELAQVAGKQPFQSMSCLSKCKASPRFCSVSVDKTIAWCSYTKARRRLSSNTYAAACQALADLNLEFCGA